MISYQVYKIMHLFGIALLLLGLGLILGAFATNPAVAKKIRLLGFLSHGLGLLLALTGGFGMAARLGIVSGLPGWIYGKLAIWLLLGAGISLTKRKPQWAPALLASFAVLVGAATFLAIFKPF
ncbi:MAG: hypothetical protein ACAH59_11360 [Pseudobdellovibrionaceae bacterium]